MVTILLFIKRLTVKEPQADLPGGIPEEGIVVIGDDGSMSVPVSEDFPVGQGVKVEE